MTQTDKRWFSLFPKELKNCIEPLVRPAFKEKGLAGSRIISDWQKIIGDQLASRCVPEKLVFPRGKQTGGTLHIAAENGFATELQHMQPVILERLAIYFGYKAIDRIAISHTVVKKSAAKLRKQVAATMAALPEDIRCEVEETKDPELRAALKSFSDTLYEKP